MRLRSLLVLGLLTLVAAVAGADTKIVQLSHQDAFTMMGQSQPASDQEQVLWIGDNRMRTDQGTTSLVVRLDRKKMYVLDHEAKTSSSVDLPLDLAQYLPSGMGQQMLEMMRFEAEVTSNGQTKTIGQWSCRGYSVSMKSTMVAIEATYWASTDIDLDVSIYYDMYSQVMAIQPGLQDVVDELRKIEGFVVAQESISRMSMMGDTSIKSSQTTVSIERTDPPAGTYDVPPGYADQPFDLMAMLQRRQGQ